MLDSPQAHHNTATVLLCIYIYAVTAHMRMASSPLRSRAGPCSCRRDWRQLSLLRLLLLLLCWRLQLLPQRCCCLQGTSRQPAFLQSCAQGFCYASLHAAARVHQRYTFCNMDRMTPIARSPYLLVVLLGAQHHTAGADVTHACAWAVSPDAWVGGCLSALPACMCLTVPLP
jgi:hypothetical protein